jgi:hypothetical protein
MPGHPQTWDRIENCSNVQEIVALSVVATDHSLLSSVVAAAFATGAEPIDGYACRLPGQLRRENGVMSSGIRRRGRARSCHAPKGASSFRLPRNQVLTSSASSCP